MIKKMITVAFAAVLALTIAPTASAAVNAVTPSANEANATRNWSHFTLTDSRPGEVDVTFTQPRGFLACFEVRRDGEPPLPDESNPNTTITDGLWPYTCVHAGSTQFPASATRTFLALESLEIRLVFGAERDERFDWTPVPVPPMTRDACVANWEAHGFTSQGGCVAYVRSNPNARS